MYVLAIQPFLGLFGLLDRDVEISFIRTFGAAASGPCMWLYRGMHVSGQVGGNDGHQGVLHKLTR